MNIKNKYTDFQILLMLSFVETWERFSFIGMRALLVLYLSTHLNFSDHKTYAIFGIFTAIGYAVPVLAGILADKLIGFQKTLIIGSAVMTLGHFFMSFIETRQEFLYLGLSLIAVGTGFFKGNIHNLLGSIHKDKDSSARDKIFSLFNIAINLGGLLAALSCGFVAHNYGWHYGFALAGMGMFIGLCVFLKYRHILGNIGLPKEKKRLATIKAASTCLIAIIVFIFALYYSEASLSCFSLLGIAFFGLLGRLLYQSDKNTRTKIISLMIILLFLVGFASIQMQLSSLINLFIHRNVDRNILEFQIPTAMFQSVNPLFVIVFGLLFANIFAHFGYKNYLKRFGLGLITNILCFTIIYLGCLNSNNGQVELIYLIFGIALISFSEICLYPMTKILFITLSPKGYKGFMMGFFMFGMSYSNLASIFIAKYMSISPKQLENSLDSIEIYKQGFLSISIFSSILFLVYLIIYPYLKRVIILKQPSS
ncbi:MAG: peptide MFS transporter [Pseudomonadota bacterium]